VAQLIQPETISKTTRPLPREKKLHQRWREEDTWVGRMDVLQLNTAHNYEHLHTHTPQGKRLCSRVGKGAYTHTYTYAHSTDQPYYLHHTEAHTQMHTGTHTRRWHRQSGEGRNDTHAHTDFTHAQM